MTYPRSIFVSKSENHLHQIPHPPDVTTPRPASALGSGALNAVPSPEFEAADGRSESWESHAICSSVWCLKQSDLLKPSITDLKSPTPQQTERLAHVWGFWMG